MAFKVLINDVDVTAEGQGSDLGYLVRVDKIDKGHITSEYYNKYDEVYFKPNNGVLITSIIRRNGDDVTNILETQSDVTISPERSSGWFFLGWDISYKDPTMSTTDVTINISGVVDNCNDLVTIFNEPKDREIWFFKTKQTIKQEIYEVTHLYIETESDHIYTNPILFDEVYDKNGNTLPSHIFRLEDWSFR